MKRKIFTSLAAAGLLACTITAVSAAPQAANPKRLYFFWRDTCIQIHAPVLPDTPDTEQTPSAPVPPELLPSGQMSQAEMQAAELVNRMRQENGLAPLMIDGSLSAKARLKSRDMKVHNYFSHNSPTYGTPFQMMQQLGIVYSTAGENIAKGYTSSEDVVHAWMNSDSHRANILSDTYTTMGIGFVDGYWTQWFIG